MIKAVDLTLLIILLLVAVIATEAIVEHVTKNDVFDWLRVLLVRVPFLGKLVTCPVCLSQWVAWFNVFTLSLIVLSIPPTFSNLYLMFIMGFVVARLSNFLHLATDKTIKK